MIHLTTQWKNAFLGSIRQHKNAQLLQDASLKGHLGKWTTALYPPSTDEKRWVDGVLARKKGLGF